MLVIPSLLSSVDCLSLYALYIGTLFAFIYMGDISIQEGFSKVNILDAR